MSKIAGAIFDVDGTLLDSMWLWNGFGERYLEKFYHIQARPEMQSVIHKFSIWEAADYLIQEYSLPKAPEKIVDEINHMIEDAYFHQIHAKKGVKAFLARLEEKQIPMCIATATDRYQIEAALHREGLDGFFQKIFTCSEVGCGKQNPKIYEEAHQYMHTPLEETWVFEDMLYAVSTAVRAGFPTVAIRDQVSWADESKLRQTANYYVNEFSELYPFFDL